MKISPATTSQNVSNGFRSRALKFRDFLFGLQKLPGFFRKEPKSAGPFAAMGPLPAAEIPGQAEKVESVASIKSMQIEAGTEELAAKLGQAAQRAVSSEQVVVSFNSGCLQGVTCVVNVQGQRVRCRFKSEGAVARKLLGEARRTVAGRLGACGLQLGEYEVDS